MAWYQKRQTKSGIVWDVAFRIIDDFGEEKKKKLCGYPTKKNAQLAYLEYMKGYESPVSKKKTSNVSKPQEVLYNDALAKYFIFCQNSMRQSSIYDISHTFEKHVEPYFGGKNLATIDKEYVYKWQEWLWGKKKENGEPYKASRLLRIRGFFHTFVRWCVKRYGIRDFLADVIAPNGRDQQREYPIWRDEEFFRFYDSISNLKYKALFITLYYSGCRIGELQALETADYNGDSINISKTYSRKTIDGSAYIINDTKNYRQRTIPLVPRNIAVLDEWIEYKKKNGISQKYLFGGDEPVSQGAIQAAFGQAIEKSGLAHIRIHDFRHSCATRLYDNTGGDVLLVARYIGDTVAQTTKTYAHLSQERLKNAVLTLDNNSHSESEHR